MYLNENVLINKNTVLVAKREQSNETIVLITHLFFVKIRNCHDILDVEEEYVRVYMTTGKTPYIFLSCRGYKFEVYHHRHKMSYIFI